MSRVGAALVLLALGAALRAVALDQHRHPVTGVPVGNSSAGVPLRKDINHLQAAGGPQWCVAAERCVLGCDAGSDHHDTRRDLYLLALLAMQRDGDDDALSYFQLSGAGAPLGTHRAVLTMAGIHSRPYIEWNGAGPRIEGSWGGYCPHAASSPPRPRPVSAGSPLTTLQENIFMPWHRPYIALFEVRPPLLPATRGPHASNAAPQQVLVDRAVLAAEFPESVRPRYLRAAETLRLPYWDWTFDPHVPPAMVPATVRINCTFGDEVLETEIPNPLSGFSFSQEILDGKYGPFDVQKRPRTGRCRAPDKYPDLANELLSRNAYGQWVVSS